MTGMPNVLHYGTAGNERNSNTCPQMRKRHAHSVRICSEIGCLANGTTVTSQDTIVVATGLATGLCSHAQSRPRRVSSTSFNEAI